MAKAQKVKPDQLMAEFIKTRAGSAVIGLGVVVIAAPFVLEYLVKGFVDKGGMAIAYTAGAAWKGITGNAKDARELIEAHAKHTADKIKAIQAEEWHEANPDVDLHVSDPEATPGKSDTETWIENMKLPASSLLLKKPADQESLNVFKNSGDWNYYGVYTLNNNDYWLVIPKGIEIYKPPIQYKDFTAARRLDFCAIKHQEGTWKDFPDCYDLKEYRELLWPTRWPV